MGQFSSLVELKTRPKVGIMFSSNMVKVSNIEFCKSRYEAKFQAALNANFKKDFFYPWL